MASGPLIPNESGSSADRGTEFERRIAHGYKRLAFPYPAEESASQRIIDFLRWAVMAGARTAVTPTGRHRRAVLR
jgi:hypothetical protein